MAEDKPEETNVAPQEEVSEKKVEEVKEEAKVEEVKKVEEKVEEEVKKVEEETEEEKVTEEKPVEEKKEEDETKVEEEKPAEVVEEKVEEKKEEPLGDEEKKEGAEHLSVDVLREQLTVVKKTREELAKVYGDLERLSKESLDFKLKNTELEEKNKVLGLEKESLSTKLNGVQEKLTKIDEIEHQKRLETLSKNFKVLGQDKTVEHLSSLPKAIVNEFEEIVKAGLKNKKNAEQLEDPVTEPSESTGDVKEAQSENLNAPADWRKDVCNTLSGEQGKEGVFKNKIVRNY